MAASVAETAAVNPNVTKVLLGNSVSAFFINGKPAVINGLRKLRNPPFKLIILVLVPLKKSSIFQGSDYFYSIFYLIVC